MEPKKTQNIIYHLHNLSKDIFKILILFLVISQRLFSFTIQKIWKIKQRV